MVFRLITLILLLHFVARLALAQEDTGFSMQRHDGELEILVDGHHFGTYVWADRVTSRPYFKQVFALGGKTQITRPHPPGPDDFDDHETFHPGIWWGFGDVGGNDYWRLKNKTVGGNFLGEPKAEKDYAEFAVRNQLLDKQGKLFCRQTCRYQFYKQRHGILIVCESTFLREQSDFWLGDQEEMGLAVRVAKSITQKLGGEIRDSEGRTERKALRTNQADWCDYRGTVDGRHGGIMLMNDPQNFRKPWWHNVETGLLVANPLGESELSGRGKQRENILVKKNRPFRLRYGVLVHLHEEPKDFDTNAAYRDFLKTLK
jgi:hypothetical protein